jgi:UDP-galactopyranose mutase
MKYDYVIVGAGIFGCVLAHELNKQGKKILVVEKRSHIGGNCYTFKMGCYHVHKYGAHIFHTKSKKIWDYMNQFCDFNNYTHKVIVNNNNRLFTLPINIMTLYQLWPWVISPKKARQALSEKAVKIDNPQNFEEWVLSQVGEEIYTLFFEGYTRKHWRRNPKEVPVNVAKRLPIRFNFDDRYFGDDYQGIPFCGYTPIFRKMLNGVEVKLDCDFFDDEKALRRLGRKLVFSGRIDELCGYRHGPLDYLSLDFESAMPGYEFLGNSVVNFTSKNIEFTRIIEHAGFYNCTPSNNLITREYPVAYDPKRSIPYYPINDDKNNALYQKYRNEVGSDVILGGRLASFKYYNMDQVVGQALALVEHGQI